jgi:tRNA dimethylallyltransferase
MSRTAVCLMGPTASGKTEFAISLCKRFPCEIISVDSALVYRGMDIGTAKPDAETLARTPHRLVDIRDPEEAYSAGDFVRDARGAMDEIFAAGKIPLLVGGTMMYFRALIQGLAELPSADPKIRREIDNEAETAGWPALHAELARVDPATAARLNPNDSQRIQRALEVFRGSGKPLSEWQQAGREKHASDDIEYVRIAVQPEPRQILHERIEERLNMMINSGFLDEVNALRERPKLTRDASSMRSVGYRQFWAHAVGEYSFDEAQYKALVATRQLAKRQVTWLRSEHSLKTFDPLEADVIDAISAFLIPFFNAWAKHRS